MNRSKIRQRGKTGLAVLVVAFIAAVACGASQAEKKEKKKDRSPSALAPMTYDPQVSLAPLVDKVAPAVVNIQTSAKVRQGRGWFGQDFPDLFEWFFGPRGPGQQPFRAPESQPERRSLGSGFIISPDGLVVTNHHVVAGADEIEVALDNEKTYKAELIGSDERTDVALLRLKKAKNLPVVKFGDSDGLKVGDHVVAIGNPFGLDHTVTAGIVSAKERVIGAGPFDDFIQTDASINPGNSGGPLFDLRGDVVGIATAIAPQGQGIGFAIPANMAARIIESLRIGGTVVRGWLGISYQPMTDELAEAFGVQDRSGVVVANVTPDSPAEKAGMKSGDVILEMNRKKINHGRELRSIVANLKPGKAVSCKVIREKKKLTLKVKIGTMPEDFDEASPAPPPSGETRETALGIEVSPLDERTKQRLGVTGLQGVVVAQVDPDSPASGVLRAGDVITEINHEKVRDMKEFEKKTKSLEKGNDLLFRIYRRGAWVYLVLRL